MQHAKRQFIRKFTNHRWMALLLTILFVLPFAEIRNHAEETFTVVTRWHRPEAHPIYLIAASPQEKMGPRPLNVPVVPVRLTPAKNDDENDLRLPFPMSAAQAVRIGNGLIEDADAQAALMYLEHARKQDPNSIDMLVGLARCYYELGRDDDALKLYQQAIAQNAVSWEAQYYLGRIQLESGRYAEAVEPLGKANNLKPDDPDTISSFGIALSKSGRAAE